MAKTEVCFRATGLPSLYRHRDTLAHKNTVCINDKGDEPNGSVQPLFQACSAMVGFVVGAGMFTMMVVWSETPRAEVALVENPGNMDKAS